jgi:uncharacterized protein YhhL (DUF1145 family)
MKNINACNSIIAVILVIVVIMVAMCFLKSIKTKEKFAEEPSFFERLQVFLFGQQKPIENDDDIVESNSA